MPDQVSTLRRARSNRDPDIQGDKLIRWKGPDLLAKRPLTWVYRGPGPFYTPPAELYVELLARREQPLRSDCSYCPRLASPGQVPMRRVPRWPRSRGAWSAPRRRPGETSLARFRIAYCFPGLPIWLRYHETAGQAACMVAVRARPC